MGYELIPVNKKCKEISYGAFVWPFMLQETGMGYVLGYGSGRVPGSYIYQKGNKCFVEYYPDLFCHIYEQVREIKPFPWKGTQGWKEVSEEVKRTIQLI